MRRLRSCLCLASRAQGLAATLDQACPSAASSITLDIVSTSGRGWLCLRGHQQGISTSTAATAAIGGSSQGRVKQAEAAEAGEPALIRVVLRQDVKGLGQRGEVVSVKRGAMRHELYPRGQAAYATPENIQLYARQATSEQRSQGEESEEAKKDSLVKLIKALNRKPVIVTRRPAPSNEDAFGEAAVSWRHVQRAVRRQLGIELDRSHVMFEGKIDAYGTYKVPLNLRLLDDTQVELTVHVDRRGAQAGPGAGRAAAPGAAGSA